MIPTELFGDTENILGASKTLHPHDLVRTLTESRDDWDGTAVLMPRLWAAPVVVDLHEWEESTGDERGVYYDILTIRDGVWEIQDGGVFIYDDETLFADLLAFMYTEVQGA